MKYLERDDIQGIVLQGYGKFEAAYALYHIGSPKKARRWLGRVCGQVSSADPDAENHCQGFRLQVAFSYPGLSKIGLDMQAFAEVSEEFVNPEDLRSHRQRALGEFDDSDPSEWEWGGDRSGKEAVHLLLAVYAPDKPRLEQLFEQLVTSDDGLRLINDIHWTRNLPAGKEHFGFRDGISQPALVDGHHRPPDAVCAGEFLFGYENEYGCYPAMPSTPENPDFGLNGTFLVARQLEQNVPKFWHDTLAAAKNDVERAKLLASRRVGRWPNGAPLLFAPRQETLRMARENDFGYGTDPFGKRCPVGAHIRRANPRDSLAISQNDPAREVRRHRIIRRGRSYGEPIPGAMSDDGAIDIKKLQFESQQPRGLFFLCLNTDIGRQFEFILQTWVNNPKFDGGYEEVDPLFRVDAKWRTKRQDQAPEFPDMPYLTAAVTPGADSAMPPGSTLTAADIGVSTPGSMIDPDTPVRRSPRHYIAVRGGEYFFLPGIRTLRYLAQLGTSRDTRRDAETAATDPLEKIPPNEPYHTQRLIRALTDKVYANNPPGAAQRDAHPKQHGTLYARFTIADNLDERLRKGLFAEAREYEALVRFSNQSNIPKHDFEKDVRGMAVKICGLQGDMVWHHGKPAVSQDFLAITHNVFTTRNVDDFDALIHAVLRLDESKLAGGLAVVRMLLSRFPSRLYIGKNYWRAFRRHSNPLHLTYFSTVPFLCGDGQAMKFRFVPSLTEHRKQGQLKPRRGQPFNYMRLGMKRVLQEIDQYEFDMEVQLRDATRDMPIENPAKPWRETDSPFLTVATLTIPAQTFDSPAQLEYGDNLSFSPWHCLKAHRPLGGINRARRVIMREVASLRHAMNRVRQPEPTSTAPFRELEPKPDPNLV